MVDETAQSLVPVLVKSDSPAKRQSVLRALDALDVGLDVVVEALMPMLEDTAPLQVVMQSHSEINLCIR